MTEKINECQCCINIETVTVNKNNFFRCKLGNLLWIKCKDWEKVELPITQKK